MDFQYFDGMFLGKQELERIRDIQESNLSPLNSLLRLDSDSFPVGSFGAPFNPKFTKLKIQSRTVSGEVGVAVGLDSSYNWYGTKVAKLGRGLVGLRLGAPLLDSDWTGKEGWVSINGLSDGTYYVQIQYAETGFENALISIDSNGLCTFPKGWGYVQDLFRTSDFGRQTRIYVSDSGVVYTVASVNVNNQTVQLVGEAGSFPVITESSFSFVFTLSPFVVESVGVHEIYTYSTLQVRLSSSSNVPPTPWYTIGSVFIESGAVQSVSLFDCETENNKYGYLDTVSENQINTRHLIDGSVTEDKLASGSVSKNKLATGAVTGEKIADYSIEPIKFSKRNVYTIDVSQNQQYELMPGQEVGGVILLVENIASLSPDATRNMGFVKFHSSWGGTSEAIKARLGQSVGCCGSFDLIFLSEPTFPCKCPLFDYAPGSEAGSVSMPAWGTWVPKGAKIYGMRINYVIVSDGNGGGIFATFGDAYGDALDSLLNA